MAVALAPVPTPHHQGSLWILSSLSPYNADGRPCVRLVWFRHRRFATDRFKTLASSPIRHCAAACWPGYLSRTLPLLALRLDPLVCGSQLLLYRYRHGPGFPPTMESRSTCGFYYCMSSYMHFVIAGTTKAGAKRTSRIGQEYQLDHVMLAQEWWEHTIRTLVVLS